MNLDEKIYTCRKKAGLSQEELAAKLGVTRQSVSKWECGAALPELDKLAAMARLFGVSADWLLSDTADGETAQTAEETAEPEQNDAAQASLASGTQTVGPGVAYPAWIDSLPGWLGKLCHRFGWLCGAIVAACGASFMGMGAVARWISKGMQAAADSMLSSGAFGGGMVFSVESGTAQPLSEAEMAAIQEVLRGETGAPVGGGMTMFNPVTALADAVLVFGAVVCIAGIVLAILLWRWGRRHPAA